MQLTIGGKEILMMDKETVSSKEAEEIGAWQLTPDGKVALAQKVAGKWGVYLDGEKISPDCKMVWGWQITEDNNFIVPIEFRKGDNLILYKDGKIAYGGKGDLITWHYENGNMWVLCIENGRYRIYCNKKIEFDIPAKNKTITKWSVLPGKKLEVTYSNCVNLKETPRTCHPLQAYVATNEWWFCR